MNALLVMPRRQRVLSRPVMLVQMPSLQVGAPSVPVEEYGMAAALRAPVMRGVPSVGLVALPMRVNAGAFGTTVRPGTLSRREYGVSYAPAGAAQRTGYPAGSFSFRTSATAFRTRPLLNAAAFQARFAEALAGLMPGVRATATAYSNANADNLVGSVSVDPSGVIDNEDRAGPSWRVDVNGTLQSNSPWSLTGDAGLNRVIARAITNAITLGPTAVPEAVRGTEAEYGAAHPAYRPPNGSQLQSVLDNPEACGSFQNTRQMWMRACTTVTPLSTLPTAPVPINAGSLDIPGSGNSITPIAPPPPTPAGTTLQPLPVGTCEVELRSIAWARSTPTFERVGPVLPVGTRLNLIGRTDMVQGTLRLFKAQVRAVPSGADSRVIGLVCFIAIDAADTQRPTGCGALQPLEGTAAAVVAPVGQRPPQVVVGPTLPASAQPAGVSGGAGGTTAFPWATAALAAGGVLLVGAAVVNRKQISQTFNTGKAKARDAYDRGKAAYRARRGG